VIVAGDREFGAGLLLPGLEDRFDLVDGVPEVARIDAGETERADVQRLVAQIGLHREVGGAHSEEVVGVGVASGVGLGASRGWRGVRPAVPCVGVTGPVP